jgi:hypothetical protein
MTDYNNYAGVFTCQKMAFAHRQSASILSRLPNLDKMYVDKVRAIRVMMIMQKFKRDSKWGWNIPVLTAISHSSQSSHILNLCLSNPILFMLVYAKFE